MGIKFRDLSVLNSFSFCKKCEPLRKSDKLEQAMVKSLQTNVISQRKIQNEAYQENQTAICVCRYISLLLHVTCYLNFLYAFGY